jgi:hypothetical protein
VDNPIDVIETLSRKYGKPTRIEGGEEGSAPDSAFWKRADGMEIEVTDKGDHSIHVLYTDLAARAKLWDELAAKGAAQRSIVTEKNDKAF